MDDLQVKIGNNLSRVRKARGLSLDKVAELTGVSKAMLAQIEKGGSNPTISILWKIATGLQLSFTSLLEEEPADASIVSRSDIPPLEAEDGAFRSYPLFPFDARTRIEIYWVDIEPGCVHVSEAHGTGVEEYILIEDGVLELSIGRQSYRLEAGQSIRFNASTPHTYANADDQPVRFHTVMSYPT